MPAAAQTSVELIALLKPSTAASAAVPTWATSAMASASMRARLGQPLELQTLFPAPSSTSALRNPDPNLPMNRLNRYVKLRFPSLTSALAMRRILLGNGLFEHVEVANILKFDYTAIQVPDPYFQTVQSGTKNYSYGGTPMLKNPYGANAPYFPPDRPSWAQEQTQWYLQAMHFPQAWDLIGDDAFDNNPSAGFYGSANVAVLDSGIDPECDPNFMPANVASCFEPGYPAPTGSTTEQRVLRPHGQLVGNLRRMQSFAVDSDPSPPQSNPFAVTASILNFRDRSSGLSSFTYSNPTPAGLEGNPNRRLYVPLATANTTLSVGHGTHTAGLIAAAMDGQGTVGTCPSCSLNFCKLGGGALDVALQLATKNGVQVINMSITGPQQITPQLMEESGIKDPLSVLATVLSTAADGQIFLVASAGNNHSEFVENQGNNLPASHPKVLAAGGSMAYYDSNGALSNQYWSERFAGARCGTAGTSNCGSNFNTSNAKKMLYAPAAHILSTMFGTWAGGAREINEAPGRILGLAGCTHELFPADSQNNLNASTHPSFNSHYGMCTGTSMSAPILSGLAGLVRSVNPLLSIDDTYSAMQNQALALTGSIPLGAQNTQQPMADKVLEKALGQFGGVVAQNRLIPMFAARSSVRDDSAAHIDWLYSSKPQMLRAAMLGDLYFNNAVARRAGTRRRVNYDASTSLPPIAGYGYGNALKNSANTPHGSFYVFATQRRPVTDSGSAPLVPLYRLVTDSPLLDGACDARKHTYATPGSTINGLETQAYFSQASRPRCAIDTVTLTATPPAANLARYSVVTIEGFVYSPLLAQPKGSVALYLRYSPSVDSFALVTANEVNRPDYAGYSPAGSTETVLGYVYENDAIDANGSIQTTDGDDWPANWELAVGLNADRADSDCDGVNDSVEYPLASLPLSDPKLSTCTASNQDNFAVAGLAKTTSTLTPFRLRNYLAVSTPINFEIEINNYLNNAIIITPNYGAASCVSSNSPDATQRWACILNLAPGAAGNELISFSASNCETVSNNLAPYVRISITSPDGYQVNNSALRALCK